MLHCQIALCRAQRVQTPERVLEKSYFAEVRVLSRFPHMSAGFIMR